MRFAVWQVFLDVAISWIVFAFFDSARAGYIALDRATSTKWECILASLALGI